MGTKVISTHRIAFRYDTIQYDNIILTVS